MTNDDQMTIREMCEAFDVTPRTLRFYESKELLNPVRQGNRLIWLCGATLLGVVVAKLFMVDLAGHGTVARIVSFVAVGLLLLVIGWFAPVPPKQE